jgi:hypothetical protein
MTTLSVKKVLTAITTILLFSCEPARVSYIDPSKMSTTQSAQENSCSVTRLSEAEIRLTCPDGTSEVIRNGVNGQNGTDGKSIEVIDPCGAESQIGFDEVLIRLPDRTLIAYFKFNSFEHLSRLSPGQTYLTTDDTHCEFKIDSDGTVYDARGGQY